MQTWTLVVLSRYSRVCTVLIISISSLNAFGRQFYKNFTESVQLETDTDPPSLIEMYGADRSASEEKGRTDRVPIAHDRRSGQRPTSTQGLMLGTASCLAVLVLLAFHGFGSFTTWTSQAQVQRTLQSQATSRYPTSQNPDGFGISEYHATTTKSMDVVHITTSANLILPRDTNNDATANANGQAADTQSLITDSDGTWVIVSSGDLNDQPYSQTTTTTILTVSLTDQVMISYKTKTQTATATTTETETETKTETKMQDHFITVTITGSKDTPQDPDTTSTGTETAAASNSQAPPLQDSSTTAKTASATGISSTTNTPQSPSPQDPQTTSPPPTPTTPSPDITTCRYLTCATSCPWNTCDTKSRPPTVMETNLCQMIDPCWLDGPDRINKPPSQGGDCACLCESGYCTSKVPLNGCKEWNCCHQCDCFVDNPMLLQKGDGC